VNQSDKRDTKLNHRGAGEKHQEDRDRGERGYATGRWLILKNAGNATRGEIFGQKTVGPCRKEK